MCSRDHDQAARRQAIDGPAVGVLVRLGGVRFQPGKRFERLTRKGGAERVGTGQLAQPAAVAGADGDRLDVPGAPEVVERRQDLPGAKTRETFVTVATEWLLSGRRSVAELPLPVTFSDVDGTPIEARIAAQWVVDVLLALEPYVPALRTYMPTASVNSPAQTGPYVR